jgi:hypothetical protein
MFVRFTSPARAAVLQVALIAGLTACGRTEPVAVEQAPVQTPQSWSFINELGDTAIVSVNPTGLTGSTFGEVSGSPGWRVRIGSCSYKIAVGGNVVPTSGGDRFSFVGLTGAGCGFSSVGSGSGTANGKFPNATTITGTVSLTTQGPLGTSTGAPGVWTARRR